MIIIKAASASRFLRNVLQASRHGPDAGIDVASMDCRCWSIILVTGGVSLDVNEGRDQQGRSSSMTFVKPSLFVTDTWIKHGVQQVHNQSNT